RAWLIEMNPRVTPICHLPVANVDLPAALYRRIKGESPLTPRRSVDARCVALFPNEICRVPASRYLQCCFHDVPWEEPELVRTVMNDALRVAAGRRGRKLVKRYFAAIARLIRRPSAIDQ